MEITNIQLTGHMRGLHPWEKNDERPYETRIERDSWVFRNPTSELYRTNDSRTQDGLNAKLQPNLIHWWLFKFGVPALQSKQPKTRTTKTIMDLDRGDRKQVPKTQYTTFENRQRRGNSLNNELLWAITKAEGIASIWSHLLHTPRAQWSSRKVK